MNPFRLKRLRTKVTGLFLFVAIAAVCGTAIVAANAFVHDKHDYVVDLDSITAPSIADSIGRHFDYLEEQLIVFGQIVKASRLLDGGESLLRSNFPKLSGVMQLDVYENGTKLVASMTTSALPAKWSFSESSLAMARASSRKRVWPEGKALGFSFWSKNSLPTLYVALLKPDVFLEHFKLARALVASVVDGRGDPVLNVGAGAGFSSALRAQVAELAQSADKQQLSARELSSGEQSSIAFLASIPDFPGLFVLVQTPSEKVSQMIHKVATQALPFVLIVLALTSVLGIVFSGRIAHPIEELTEATSKIAEGKWKVSVQTHSNDEIGRLVRGFTRMGRELEDRESRLHAAQEELIRAERLAVLGRFGAGIAHEVKNPLNGILSHAQLIERMLGKLWQSAPRDASLDQSLKFILDETRRANSIISDLLTFSRQKPLSTQRCSIGELVAKACAMVAPQAAERKVRIEQRIKYNDQAGHEPCREYDDVFANIDADQILQVLLNLMTNAFHAMEDAPAEKPRVLTAGVSADQKFVSIVLADTGSGISPENQKKLFEPFFTTKAAGKGTGLGLSLCHGIVSQHRGKILVSSELGKGTAFTIQLPAIS